MGEVETVDKTRILHAIGRHSNRATMSTEQKNSPENTPQTRSYSAWMGFATREVKPGKSVKIRIRWGRIAVLMLILGGIGWMGKSWALYYFFREVREFEAVSFADMVMFPLNRAAVRTEQGNYQIEEGKAAMEREDYRRAFSLLREGVARAPSNLEGRMLLAQLYVGWRPDLATELMVDGLDHGQQDVDFVRQTLLLLLSQKEDQKILELTEGLQQQELPENILQIVHVARLQASMMTGRYDIVREIFENTAIENTMDGLILGTQLYARSGRPEDAIEVLNSAIATIPPANSGPLKSQLVRILKEEKLYDRAREVALDMVIQDPMEWRSRIQLIDILSASGLQERRDREITALISEHRNSEQAMTTLAQLAADYGNVRAAKRLYELALENGYSLSMFSLSLAEAMVRNGDYRAAIELCNDLVREDPDWIFAAEGGFNAIRSLAYFGDGDNELGNLYLKNFLDSRQASAGQLYQAAVRFEELGLGDQALRILREAYRRDARNEQVLTMLVEVEMSQGAFITLDEHLRALFDLRRPDYDQIEEIHDRLRSDQFLFTEGRVELLDNLARIVSEPRNLDWSIWERTPAEAPESTESSDSNS